MTKRPGKAVTIAVVGKSSTLSKSQKSFNRLIKQIEQKRQQLAAWEATIPRYQKKHIDEMVPLNETIQAMQARMVLRLDQAHGKKGLTRKERGELAELIVQLASGLPTLRDNAELQAIYNKHSTSDFESDLADDKQMIKDMLEEMMGIQLDDDVDLESPEDFMRKAQTKLAEKQESDAAAREAREAKRKKTAKQVAREAAEEAAEKEISESIREVYRKLASALHPDREPDPEERERKNALMQKANKAYDSRNLLQLLELQLELEHIDPAALAQLSEDRLKRYNVILKDQVRELEMELIHVEADFIARFRIDSMFSLRPDYVLQQLDNELAEKQEGLLDMERDLVAFEDINAVKSFLRSMRQAARDSFLDIPF